MRIKNNSGFTIIEIIAVLIVMGIITAFAVGRVADNKPELIAQKEVLKVHLRYAQSRAMNSNDNYGIESNGNTYWLFRVSGGNRVNLPSEQANHIDLAALGLSLSMPDGSIISFDSKGIPYTAYSGSQQMSDRTLTLSSGSDNESITITKNTGFIE
jgi:prepilin-type N-terminal cleavage/methylation domain-containing protein